MQGSAPFHSQASSTGNSDPVTETSMVTKSDSLKAEILWVLQTINANASFHANATISKAFSEMFPDSDIAARLSCGETKTMYVACYDIAPHILRLLEKKVKDQEYVLIFDESLNTDLQKKQTDYHIRYWEGPRVES